MKYGVEQIKTLESLEAIRLRAGMYVGSTEIDGVHHIALEVISNCVDEYLAGACNKIEINVNEENTVKIKDNGRGVPFSNTKEGKEKFINIFTKLHTGAKFDSSGKSGYNSSGGLNGVGAKATNALSESFAVESRRDKKKAIAVFAKGELKNFEIIADKNEEIGTTIIFKPDAEIFKEGIELDYNRLRTQIQELAYLSPGLTFIFKYKDKREEIIVSKEGIKDYIKDLTSKKKTLTSIFYAEALEDRVGVKLVMQYTDAYSDTYKLFTNNIPNTGGTHLTGFRTALTQAINEYAKEHKLLKEKDSNLTGEELKEGLTLVLSFIMPDPVFSGQTKEVLTSGEARTIVQRLVSKELRVWLNTHSSDAKAIIEKALLARTVREKAKKAKDLARKPKEKGLKAKMQLSNKFIDCVNKNSKERNLLLVEGLSAGSAAIEARNAKTDCIYMLRGKIISPLKQSLEKIMNNQEISDIVKIIGGGFGDNFDINKVNFDKVVITVDQDSDGENISLLLITFFFTYMRPLIEAGKLYRAITPLYILRKNKEELYFYSDEELEKWRLKNDSSGYDILRAKGLGELNASDLHTVCFENQRFKRITISDIEETEKLLTILQGSDVKPRKEYIYNNAEKLGFNFD